MSPAPTSDFPLTLSGLGFQIETSQKLSLELRQFLAQVGLCQAPHELNSLVKETEDEKIEKSVLPDCALYK